jgi:hypothetical protein
MSASPPRILVSYTFANRYIPAPGEIIVVCLSQSLFGPGSIIGSSQTLPSCAHRHNFHHAVVITSALDDLGIHLTVFPMPAYSFTDPVSRLSSTRWLLAQPPDFQNIHIPVPYEEEAPTLTSIPDFPTPARFGEPLHIGGWKDKRPSWVQATPQVADLTFTTIVRILFYSAADMSYSHVWHSSNVFNLLSY